MLIEIYFGFDLHTVFAYDYFLIYKYTQQMEELHYWFQLQQSDYSRNSTAFILRNSDKTSRVPSIHFNWHISQGNCLESRVNYLVIYNYSILLIGTAEVSKTPQRNR